MTSLPLDSLHDRQRWAWHDITAHGQHTRSDDVVRGMTSPPLDNTHDQTMSGVACHHRLWTAHTVGNIGLGIRSPALDSTHGRHGMTSPPLDSTNGQMTSGVACHRHLWTTHTVELRRAWHAIIVFGQHTRSNDVGRGMPSSHLGSTHDRTTSGGACHHCLWAAQTVERRLAWHAIFVF